MRNWHAFLDSIDSDGGHIVVLVLLMVLARLSNRDDVMTGAFGALLLALKNAGSNSDRNK